MFDLNDFLNAREKRVMQQNELIDRYSSSLISMRCNYPGEDKNCFVSTSIVKIMYNEIIDIFADKILNISIINSLEGRSYLLNVEMDSLELKKIVMDLENDHILGRCVDIDVFSKDGTSLSRQDFGLPKRKCYICHEMAFVCSRNKTHTLKEIEKQIFIKYNLYLETNKKMEELSGVFSDLALKAMILEVSTHPSFGLVSPLTSGSHKDMDYFTFLESSFSIKPYFKKMADFGYSPLTLDIIFKKIRRIGIEAEKDMFVATKNINTHKGMIFIMGIAVAAAAKAKYENIDFQDISKIIRHMCSDIMDDFKDLELKDKLTHGEKLYLEHGIKGIRGEVIGGLQNIFSGGLTILEDSLKKNPNINLAMIQTLLFFMANLEDSTILHRHGIDVLNKVKTDAAFLLNKGGVYSENGLKEIEKMEKEYIELRISPGGSADSLAVTLFLHEIKLLK
ncbi:MAG: triphosphoribosyl-dephospho-CoA synthase CitG [Fusobacteriaceae bacterium]